jgi:hypothetical protein
LMRWHYHLGHLTFAKLKQLDWPCSIPPNVPDVSSVG